MIKLMGSLIKTALFCLITLVLGAWVQWQGKPINRYFDGLVANFKPPQALLKDAETLSRDLVKSTQSQAQVVVTAKKNEKAPSVETSHPDVTPSERQKLKILIRELNRDEP